MNVIKLKQPPRLDCLLAIPEVEKIVGFKKSTIYSLMQEGKFPRPIKVTGRIARWPESVVLQWVNDLIVRSSFAANDTTKEVAG